VYLVSAANDDADEGLLLMTFRLQSCCEDLKLKTAELDRLQETVAGLQSQLSNQNECLRLDCCLWQSVIVSDIAVFVLTRDVKLQPTRDRV